MFPHTYNLCIQFIEKKKRKTEDNNKRKRISKRISKLQWETIKVISMENKFLLKNKNDLNRTMGSMFTIQLCVYNLKNKKLLKP